MTRHQEYETHIWPEGPDDWRLVSTCQCGDQLATSGDSHADVWRACGEWCVTHARPHAE